MGESYSGIKSFSFTYEAVKVKRNEPTVTLNATVANDAAPGASNGSIDITINSTQGETEGILDNPTLLMNNKSITLTKDDDYTYSTTIPNLAANDYEFEIDYR
jgi:hypothetical protein